MIDKTKNVCYVIRVLYMRNGKECSQKFLSLHGVGTKKFKEFRDKYFKEVLSVSPKKIGGHDGDIGSQFTISKESWERQKASVLEGITEAEKCY